MNFTKLNVACKIAVKWTEQDILQVHRLPSLYVDVWQGGAIICISTLILLNETNKHNF